jgi:hypothetical protein
LIYGLLEEAPFGLPVLKTNSHGLVAVHINLPPYIIKGLNPYFSFTEYTRAKSSKLLLLESLTQLCQMAFSIPGLSQFNLILILLVAMAPKIPFIKNKKRKIEEQLRCECSSAGADPN